MFASLSAHAHSICTSPDYQASLDDCIERLSKLQVNGKTTNINSNTSANKPTNATETIGTPPPKSELTVFPPSSPPSLLSRSSSPSPTSTTMNCQKLHGGPPRGQQNTLESQDARNNLAIQPAANTGTLKLKKNAVKIVGAASSAPRAPPRAVAPVSLVTSSLAPQSENVRPANMKEVKSAQSATNITSFAPPSSELLNQSGEPEKNLESMFARLSKQSLPSPIGATPVTSSLAGPDKDMFLFEDKLGAADTTADPTKSNTNGISATPIKSEEPGVAASSVTQGVKVESPKDVGQQKTEKGKRWEGMTQDDIENQYLRKASDYIEALPAGEPVVHNIQTVLKKLRGIHAPDNPVNDIVLDTDGAEKLKAQYVSAVVDHVNKTCNKREASLTTEYVQRVLEKTGGNFLLLCSTLVDQKFLSLSKIDEIAGLCNAVVSVLPTPTATTTSTEQVSKPSNPANSVKAWPAQEKRENPAAVRTCLIKGASGIRTINQLQALVWGGRLESLSMPEGGSSYALVRFLTPEACDKYFRATENGIEIAGDKKTVVFVEKQSGPTSINDVIQNCIDNDMTRCVRAYEADQGWGDLALMKLARGKGQDRREVDRIKRGKTAKGRSYIEFRFANIYHAMNFNRRLSTDENWEPCSIVYAPDPCETAQGVHYKDEDEDGYSDIFA